MRESGHFFNKLFTRRRFSQQEIGGEKGTHEFEQKRGRIWNSNICVVSYTSAISRWSYKRLRKLDMRKMHTRTKVATIQMEDDRPRNGGKITHTKNVKWTTISIFRLVNSLYINILRREEIYLNSYVCIKFIAREIQSSFKKKKRTKNY